MVGKRIVFLHLGVQFPILSQLCKKLGGQMPIPKDKENFDQVFRPGDKVPEKIIRGGGGGGMGFRNIFKICF
jgi:hypothetical protein